MKSAQLFFRDKICCAEIPHVELGHLGAVTIAAILNLKANGKGFVFRDRWGAYFQIGVGEASVREAETEGEKHLFLSGIVIAVPDKDAFPVMNLSLIHIYYSGRDLV